MTILIQSIANKKLLMLRRKQLNWQQNLLLFGLVVIRILIINKMVTEDLIRKWNKKEQYQLGKLHLKVLQTQLLKIKRKKKMKIHMFPKLISLTLQIKMNKLCLRSISPKPIYVQWTKSSMQTVVVVIMILKTTLPQLKGLIISSKNIFNYWMKVNKKQPASMDPLPAI